MKFKGFRYDGLFIIAISVAAAIFAAVTAVSYDTRLAIAESVVFFLIFLYGFVRLFTAGKKYKRMLSVTAVKLDYSDNKVLSSIPFPVAVCNEEGYITWSNDLFVNDLMQGNITQLSNINIILGGNFKNNTEDCINVGDCFYIVTSVCFFKDGVNYTAYKFTDCTELKLSEIKYFSTKPYIIIAETDNIDDNRDLFRDSEKTEIKSKIEGMLEAWAEGFNAVMKRISDDRLMIIAEKSNVDNMINDKFSIIDKVRNCTYKDKNINVTLSIGAASSETIKDTEKQARKSLDIALSRGGDQAAVLNDDGNYIFFGGVSKSSDKKYKIKSRLWASQLVKLMDGCSNVIVLGHSSSDFDSIGSAFGIAYACSTLGIKTDVVYNSETTLAGPLLDDILSSEYSGFLINSETAKSIIDKRTLLILTDTHITDYSDCPELFGKTDKIAVIDHHRLKPGTQTEKYLFVHNPNASSASEIVTEMIQYIVKDEQIPAIVAQALLTGITLDTKGFVLRSGTRTFEAAAYLRSNNADSVKVSKYFNNSPEISKVINQVILNSEIYGSFAVSQVPNEQKSQRLIASKAADELLNTQGIKASFVIFTEGSSTCISARSLGETNVQLIMEAFGGGGHQTMAACKMENSNREEAEKLLLERLNSLNAEGSLK